MASSLQNFISHAREKGMDHQTIRMLLLSAGWKEKDVASALASESLTMPVPSPSDAGTARDAFLHLLAFATLYTTVVSLIILIFQYINKYFPDASEAYYYNDASSSAIRWSMACIIVAFPIFLYVSRILYKECSSHHEKLASGVRKWLTYLTLFITAMTLIGDVITLFFYFFDGELSTRFILKVLAVFLLAGVPFSYYFLTLRMEPEEYAKSPIHVRYRWLSIAVVLIAFVSGFFIVGSPASGRDQRFDDRRVEDLRAINNAIYEHVYGSGRWDPSPTKLREIPTTLEEVAESSVYQVLNITDPETGELYGYEVEGEQFRVCATFAQERTQQFDAFWNHPAGYHCFESDITDTRSK